MIINIIIKLLILKKSNNRYIIKINIENSNNFNDKVNKSFHCKERIVLGI